MIPSFHQLIRSTIATGEEYNYRQTGFNHFHLKTLREYSDLNLTTDVKLFSDILLGIYNL